ncbi:MAG: class I SAM-dependent methyltransferase [Anaerolineales bacterium]|nr:class I SAM-dependent methyltransferase [Anaerolineales bacterium]
MQASTDWISLWRELVELQASSHAHRGGGDAWQAKARGYDQRVKRRWEQPDSSRTFVVSRLQAYPGATVLDIGAGTGAWMALLAQHARWATAVEPSPTMVEVLRHNVAETGLDNVTIIQGAWPAAEVEPHDFSLCSHAMYGVADFPAFIRRMEAVTRRTCFLLLRAPTPDGVMAEAAMHVWKQPYDSPNFQVAYNALLQIGIFPHVLMEDTGLWEPWTHASLDDALADVKQRFGLVDRSEHDDFLRDLLKRRLTQADGQVIWPRSVRSALVYWDVA